MDRASFLGMMPDLVEILVTSESTGQLWNANAWNPTTGASLKAFKGGSSASKTLCLVRDEYLIGADPVNTVINVWSINLQGHKRVYCPGLVTALAVSRDGVYCVAGIGEKLYIWQTSNGELMAKLDLSVRKVTCIRYTDDGSHFVVGTDGGMVYVWESSLVLTDGAKSAGGSTGTAPFRHWSHDNAITDIHVGLGGAGCRVYSASHDKSVKVVELSTGCKIATWVFETPITSVVTDDAEFQLYAGGSDGGIYVIDLDSPANRYVLRGHRGQVTCLSMNLGCYTLASASDDGSVILWDTTTKESIETIKHKGKLTNCFIARAPINLLDDDSQRFAIPFAAHFKFPTDGHGGGADEEKKGETVNVLLTTTVESRNDFPSGKPSGSLSDEAKRAVECKRRKPDQGAGVDLEAEVARLLSVNNMLYQAGIILVNKDI